MDDAKQLWQWWQCLLVSFRCVFTQPGWVRFVQWVTGTVLCWEEHTITQMLVSIGLESRWRVAEHFAEYGAWKRPSVERQLVKLIEQQQPAAWEGYRVVALDDTKLHRTSENVWGTCTFHEPAFAQSQPGLHRAGLDEGTDPADLPSATGGDDAAAIDPAAARPSTRGGPVVAQARVEPPPTPSVTPRSAPTVLALPKRLFALPVRTGKH